MSRLVKIHVYFFLGSMCVRKYVRTVHIIITLCTVLYLTYAFVNNIRTYNIVKKTPIIKICRSALSYVRTYVRMFVCSDIRMFHKYIV